MSTAAWGSDTPVSMPVAPTNPIEVDFGGFGFTSGGITHAMSESDRERMTTPLFGPEGA